jgi:putative intracellular protease/amidase
MTYLCTSPTALAKAGGIWCLATAVIRVSIREVAKNKQDLIGFALPLQNQPSDLQALIEKLTIAKKLEVEEEEERGGATGGERRRQARSPALA